MTFTSHGHYIPGSPVEEGERTHVHRCGGVSVCEICAGQAAQWLERERTAGRLEEEPNLLDPQTRAKEAIADYWRHYANDDSFTERGIVVVWFAYILGGWKTLMFINEGANNYFEVTYNVNKQEMYLDHYQKVHNEAIEDSSDFNFAKLRKRLSE